MYSRRQGEKTMATTKRLGQVLTEKGLVTSEQINEALRIQVGGNRRIGYILTQMKLITEDQLLEVLSDQIDVPIISIDQEFKQEVKSILPRYLCKRYTVIPVSLGKNNVMNLAMIDPSDDDAIKDIEQYTNMAVKPVLANGREINTAIEKFIPLSSKDILNSTLSNRVLKIAGVFALLLLCLTGFFTYKYIQIEKYGTITVSGDVTTYKNHDLMLGVEKNSISLLGHGAYAEGFYKVSFSNPNDLKSFLERKQKSFSEKQYNWLMWVVNDSLPSRS